MDSHRPRITRRGVQIALGILWLLDGVLQLQPEMFTSNFANNVIIPAAQGQPDFVSIPMQFFAHIFLVQPIFFNALIAVIQLSLGVLILWKRTTTIGLWGSVAWGLFVWYIGEGLNGLASGHTLLLMGAPGAALIYALLALGVLPLSSKIKNQKSIDHRPAYLLLVAWILFWTMGTVYQLLPGQNTVADISTMISTNASSAPSWMANVDKSAASFLNSISSASPSMDGMVPMTPSQMAAMSSHQAPGLPFLLLLALLQIATGFAVIIPGAMRLLSVGVGCLLSIIFWVVGQSMGSYFSGLATDPNTGPLFILLGIAILGCTQYDTKVRQFFRHAKERFVTEMRAFNEDGVIAE